MKLSEMNFFAEEDYQAWEYINDTHVDRDEQETIVASFYQAALANPSHIAISLANIQLSYGQLNEASNQIAHLLFSQGMKPGDSVALSFGTNHHFYVALLSTLKAGGCYVPLESDLPVERLRFVLADSRAQFLLTEKSFFEKHRELIEKDLIVVVLDEKVSGKTEGTFDIEEIGKRSVENIYIDIQNNAPMYIMYTSGTTGKPKGVRIRQSSVLNFIHWFREVHSVSCKSRIAQNAPVSFDPSIQQIFPALTSGATLLPVTNETRRDPYLLLTWLREQQVTHVNIVPSHWLHLLRTLEETSDSSLARLPHLEWIVIGGESLHYQQVWRWYELVASAAQIDHVYGPTEATINATYFVLDQKEKKGKVPIGKPLSNYQVYVLDQSGNLCPPHIFGEIYIGGRGVASGYQDEEQTRAAFVSNPFTQIDGDRLYKTGDRGRLICDASGNAYFEFGGRLDSQVKISGHRIELEEIEVVAKGVSGVQDAVAAVRGTGSDQHIVCFYISSIVEPTELRNYLRNSLPTYMLPVTFIQLDHLPYTPNGKVDKKKLLALSPVQSDLFSDPNLRPHTTLERTILDIWQKILHVDNIDRDANFFEIGSNSFLTLSFVSKLQLSTAYTCRIADVYTHPTAAELAAFLERDERRVNATHSPPVKSLSAGRRVVSATEMNTWIASVVHQQFRCKPVREIKVSPSTHWFLHSAWPGKPSLSAFTLVYLRMNFALDARIFARAVQDTLAAHPLLRASLSIHGGKQFKFVENSFDGPIVPILDFSEYEERSIQDFLEQLQKMFRKMLVLTEPPLFRYALIQRGPQEYYFVWTISHLITDGESIRLIEEELQERYRHYNEGLPFARSNPSTSYEEYVRDIQSTTIPNLDSHIKYMQDYVKAVENLKNCIYPVKGTKRIFFNEAVDVAIEELQTDGLTDIIVVLYAICVTALAQLCPDVKVLPFATVYHGRAYNQSKTYFDVVGDLTDFVPILLPTRGEAGRDKQLEDIARILKEVSSRQVNYGRLLDQISRAQGNERLIERLVSVTNPVIFNFFDKTITSRVNSSDFEVLSHEEGYEEEKDVSIAISIVKRGKLLKITLLGQQIKEETMRSLWIILNQELNAFRRNS